MGETVSSNDLYISNVLVAQKYMIIMYGQLPNIKIWFKDSYMVIDK